MSSARTGAAIATSSMLAGLAALAQDAAPPQVDFARDVRPILEQHCVACHGPEKDKAELRLDVRARAFAGARGGTEPVIERGDATRSSLYLRLVTDDADERMPQKAPPLAPADVETIRRWIDEGAVWPDEWAGSVEKGRGHWSFRPPTRPELPRVEHSAWVRNPLDTFVLARLERAGLAPAPEADRATLIRRLSLDLIGLPPTPEDVAAFEGDTSPDAYERLVERLLASPHHGERLARPWLDLARYADTHGYEKDARRTMWPWRDWVIDAFNANMPFDRFTIEQLAGDLLPNATPSQRVATGFHRNTMLNEEGGTDPEEFRSDAVLDRVNTTATVWMGATLACAQCHDHKYDPFTQRDYYALYAAFNSTADGGKDSEPVLRVPTDAQRAELARLDADIARLERALAADDVEMDAEQRSWEEATARAVAAEPRWTPFVPTSVSGGPDEAVTFAIAPDGAVTVGGAEPDQPTYVVRGTWPRGDRGGDVRFVRIEVLPLDGGASPGPGRASHGNFVLSEFGATLTSGVDGHGRVALAFDSADADFEQSNGAFRAANSIDGESATGWAIGDQTGRAHAAVFRLVSRPDSDGDAIVEFRLEFHSSYARHALGRFRVSISDDPALAARFAEPRAQPWRVAGPFTAASFDAARDTVFGPEAEHLAGAVYSTSYADGSIAWRDQPWPANRLKFELQGERCATYLERTISSDADRLVELYLGGDDVARVWLDGKLIHASDDYTTYTKQPVRTQVRLHRGANRLLAKVVNGSGGYGFAFGVGRATDDRVTPEITQLARTPRAARTAEQSARLREWFRRGPSARGAALADELATLRRRRAELETLLPQVLVMTELEKPRETHVFVRGSFLAPGDRVEPGVPALFGRLEARGERPRLALARWLVSDRNPLVARVTVNRLWEMLFGRGIVATVQDFGTRGEAPNQPELLDWLAVEFVESGWDVRHVLRTIVGSATYRQTSDVPSAAYARDPDNLLLARGARFRVEVEMVRDIALECAGLLSPRIGGPSVFPPQIPGVWNSAYSGDDWRDDEGAQRFSRGLYTFWKRTSPYVTYTLFEAPSREVACPRRARTNTPLQALALLDDPTFVEASVALGQRLLREARGDDRSRVERGFRLCVARRPSTPEVDALVSLVADARKQFAADPGRAERRVRALSVDRDDTLDVLELAAWTSVASVLLNYGETITRN